VSFRVAPQVLAQLRRTLGRLDEDVRRALVAVTDSPAVAGGRAVAGGGFHAVGLAAGMDAAAVALVQAAELAGQRLHRLLDGRFSGLPDQLSPDPGPVTGLVVVHKRAVGALHEARRLAVPARRGGCAAPGRSRGPGSPGRRPGWGRSPPASRTWSLPWTGTDRSAPT
jgi:histidine ammonia-lyase